MRLCGPLLSLLLCGCGSERAPDDLLSSVDLRIGTGGQGWWAGNAFVGAALPGGLVQVGPDGAGDGWPLPWNHCSGFHASDTCILAFSHTHLHGTGMPDLGTIGFMAFAGPMNAQRLSGRGASLFDRESLQARPWLFTVDLPQNGVRAELTALARTAFHRYRLLPAAPEERLTVLVDLGHTLPMGAVLQAEASVDSRTGRLTAAAFFENEFSRAFDGLRIYLHALPSRPPLAVGAFRGEEMFPGQTQASSTNAGLWLEFAGDAPLELAVGVSYTDARGAEGNWRAAGGLDFERAAAEAREAWADAFSRVRLYGANEDDRAVFATALAHALLMPSAFDDADGRFLAPDGSLQAGEGFAYYTNFSLWDTYRCLHSLLLLLYPERQREMALSLLAHARHGGYLPRWPMGPRETGIMIGTPADVMLSESCVKGLDIPCPEALAAMLRLADGPPAEGSGFAGREGIEDYLSLGYVPAGHAAAVSNTLEFAIADDAIGRLAGLLGENELAERFSARAQSYRNLFDSQSGYFRLRDRQGAWVEPFDPLASEFRDAPAFAEGNALQYLWLVPHDPAGLLELLGGQGAAWQRLQEFMEEGRREQEEIFAEEHDELWWMTHAPRYYWHGNEPDIHAPYLFLHFGRPDLAQYWVRWIGDRLYANRPDGIPGNDDTGTLSAWYLFSSLGFYPVPGSDVYLVGTPRFERVELALPGGTLAIEAEGASRGMTFVRGLELNGARLERPWFRHADIARGGTLRFELSSEPAAWGVVAPGESWGSPDGLPGPPRENPRKIANK